jgi:hypothetical protein
MCRWELSLAAVFRSGFKQTQAVAAIPARSSRRRHRDKVLSALRRHPIFNQADDASDDCAGNATPDRLAGESTDVDIVARPGHHRNERTK